MRDHNLLCLLVLALVAVCHSAVYYVDSQAGAGGDGSQGSPYEDLADALTAATGADEIRIADMGDTYAWGGAAKTLENIDGTFKIVGTSDTPAKISASIQAITVVVSDTTSSLTLVLENIEFVVGRFPSPSVVAFLTGDSTAINQYNVEMTDVAFDIGNTVAPATTGARLVHFKDVDTFKSTNVTFKGVGSLRSLAGFFEVMCFGAMRGVTATATLTNTVFEHKDGTLFDTSGFLMYIDNFDDVTVEGVKVTGLDSDDGLDYVENVLTIDRPYGTVAISGIETSSVEVIDNLVTLSLVREDAEITVSDTKLDFNNDGYGVVVLNAANTINVAGRRGSSVAKSVTLSGVTMSVATGVLGEVSMLRTGGSSDFKVKTLRVEHIHHVGATSSAPSAHRAPALSPAVFYINADITMSLFVQNVTFAGFEDTPVPSDHSVYRILFDLGGSLTGGSGSFTDIFIKGGVMFETGFSLNDDGNHTIDGLKVDDAFCDFALVNFSSQNAEGYLRNIEVAKLDVVLAVFMAQEGDLIVQQGVSINSLDFDYSRGRGGKRREGGDSTGGILGIAIDDGKLSTEGDHKIGVSIPVVKAIADSARPPFTAYVDGEIDVKVELTGCGEGAQDDHNVDAFCEGLNDDDRRRADGVCTAAVTDSRKPECNDSINDDDVSPASTATVSVAAAVLAAVAVAGALF